MTGIATSPGAWCSKAGWSGKAHFVLADGTTACAEAMGPRGERMGDLIKATWKPLDTDDHLCALCLKKHPRECMCGVCRIRPARTRSSR